MRGEDVVRFREDGIVFFIFTESKRDAEGLLNADFTVLQHPRGPVLTLEGIEDVETQPGLRAITMKLPRAYNTGETIGIAWEETCEYGPDAPEWTRYFAAVEAPNDNAEIEATVHFTNETDLPKLVWHYGALPDVDHFEIGPKAGQEMTIGRGWQVGHLWPGTQTERRIEYCLQWSWTAPRSL